MNEDLGFRIAVAVLFLLMGVVRWPRRHLTGLKASWPGVKKHPIDAMILFLCGLAWLAAFVMYLFFPAQISCCRFGLPDWLRWAAAAPALAALALLGWADHCLGSNLSVTLQIKDDHSLITSGPYRWIRHPAYASALLFSGAVFLVSANWLVGACLLGGMTILVASRIPREERMMIGRFGDRYRQYIKRTGGLLPRTARSSSAGDNGGHAGS